MKKIVWEMNEFEEHRFEEDNDDDGVVVVVVNRTFPFILFLFLNILI
jgi:hypothetical protein